MNIAYINMAIISTNLLQKIRIFALDLIFTLLGFHHPKIKRMTTSEYQYSYSIVILFYYSKPITDFRSAFNELPTD